MDGEGEMCKVGITPAGAGSGQNYASLIVADGDHPRGRGEWFLKSLEKFLILGSPPRARGVGMREKVHNGRQGITPAGAGSGPVPSVYAAITEDHPRGRGEWASKRADELREQGSPPRARGVVMLAAQAELPGGITPAGAGSGVFYKLLLRVGQDHPRGRGEWRELKAHASFKVGSPPRARGVALSTVVVRAG